MFNRAPNPQKLTAIAGQLRTRADQLDRDGKFGAAQIQRTRADKLDAKAKVAA